MRLTPVNEFKWPESDYIGPLYTLTCKNHPSLRWSTKHPTYRSVHYLGLDPNIDTDKLEPTDEILQYLFRECACMWEDLMVIEEEDPKVRVREMVFRHFIETLDGYLQDENLTDEERQAFQNDKKIAEEMLNETDPGN